MSDGNYPEVARKVATLSHPSPGNQATPASATTHRHTTRADGLACRALVRVDFRSSPIVAEASEKQAQSRQALDERKRELNVSGRAVDAIRAASAPEHISGFLRFSRGDERNPSRRVFLETRR